MYFNNENSYLNTLKQDSEIIFITFSKQVNHSLYMVSKLKKYINFRFEMAAIKLKF